MRISFLLLSVFPLVIFIESIQYFFLIFLDYPWSLFLLIVMFFFPICDWQWSMSWPSSMIIDYIWLVTADPISIHIWTLVELRWRIVSSAMPTYLHSCYWQYLLLLLLSFLWLVFSYLGTVAWCCWIQRSIWSNAVRSFTFFNIGRWRNVRLSIAKTISIMSSADKSWLFDSCFDILKLHVLCKITGKVNWLLLFLVTQALFACYVWNITTIVLRKRKRMLQILIRALTCRILVQYTVRLPNSAVYWSLWSLWSHILEIKIDFASFLILAKNKLWPWYFTLKSVFVKGINRWQWVVWLVDSLLLLIRITIEVAIVISQIRNKTLYHISCCLSVTVTSNGWESWGIADQFF